jgi:hypothetical protein
MKRSAAVQSIEPEAEDTGLPWLRTWKGVYFAVIISFVLWLTLLIALTAFFS